MQINAASGGSTVANVITGSGGLIQNNANTLTLTAANNYTGPTTITQGTLSLAHGGGNTIADTSGVVFNNATNVAATLQTAANEALGTLSGGNGSSTVNIAAGTVLTLSGDGTNASYAGIINANGTGALAKTGTGTQTLTGTITGGALQGDQGMLVLGMGGSLTTAGVVIDGSSPLAVVVAADATFTNAGTILATSNTGPNEDGVRLRGGTFNNTNVVSAKTSGVYAQAGGTIANTAGSITGQAFGVYLNESDASTLTIRGGGSIVGTDDNGIYATAGTGDLTFGTTASGEALGNVSGGTSGIFATTGGTGSINIAVAGTVTGKGNEAIVAKTTGTGGVTISARQIQASTDGIVATSASGAVAVTAGGAVTAGTGSGISVSGNNATNTVTANSTVEGAIGLDIAGTGTTMLTNNSSIASTAMGGNALQIDGGTLSIGNAIGTLTGNIAIVNKAATMNGANGPSVLNLAYTNDGPLALGNTITGAGVLNSSGSGLVSFTGTNSDTDGQFDGTANVTAGTLSVNGTFGDTGNFATATVNVGNGTTANSGILHGSGTIAAKVNVRQGGTISAGNSPGVLKTGSLNLAGGSTFLEEIAGSTPAASSTMGYDQVNVTGTVSLGGATLKVSALDGFVPTAGQSYTIINNDGDDAVQGTFVDANGKALTEGSTVTVNGVALVISYKGGTGNDVTLTDPVPPPSGGSGPSTTPTPGPDYLTVAAGGTVAALAGNDTINGAGSNLLLGNQDQDLITAGPGPNTVYGGMGDDTIMAGDGNDLLYGDEGSDSITAGNGNNTVVGGQDSTDGADLIRTGTGNDVILGNGGDDSVASGGGSDTVVGGYGRDLLLGQQGDDVMLGNQGNDTLYGGMGNDTLYGGQDDDVLYGNEGDDLLYGNEGRNTFVFAPGDTDFRSMLSTGDTVGDFVTGTDRIDFASGPAGSASNFGATSTTSTDFATIQALGQQLLSMGDTYAFVADGQDGFLFTTGGSGTAIADAVKLAGAGSQASLRYQDIAHGALA